MGTDCDQLEATAEDQLARVILVKWHRWQDQQRTRSGSMELAI